MKRWLVGLLLVPLVGFFLLMIIVVNSKRDLGAALEKLEANIRRNEKGEVVEVGFYGPKITDAGLVHLKGLTNLKSLGLHNTQITDAGRRRTAEGVAQLQDLQVAVISPPPRPTPGGVVRIWRVEPAHNRDRRPWSRKPNARRRSASRP